MQTAIVNQLHLLWLVCVVLVVKNINGFSCIMNMLTVVSCMLQCSAILLHRCLWCVVCSSVICYIIHLFTLLWFYFVMYSIYWEVLYSSNLCLLLFILFFWLTQLYQLVESVYSLCQCYYRGENEKSGKFRSGLCLHPSIHLFVHLFPRFLWNWLAVDLELLHASMSCPQLARYCRSRSWVRLMQAVRPRSRAVFLVVVSEHLQCIHGWVYVFASLIYCFYYLFKFAIVLRM